MVLGKFGGTLGRAAGKAKREAEDVARDAEAKPSASDLRGPSPNPMTNLIIADLALRGGTQLVAEGVERLVLGKKYAPGMAKKVMKGRSLKDTLIGTALARLATRSVPGAILVGGALLAKTLYDRAQDHGQARAEGEKDLREEARKG